LNKLKGKLSWTVDEGRYVVRAHPFGQKKKFVSLHISHRAVVDGRVCVKEEDRWSAIEPINEK
jgi:hypothetical protein